MQVRGHDRTAASGTQEDPGCPGEVIRLVLTMDDSGETPMQTDSREARLRLEFAALYPTITPGVWQPAARVA